MALTSAQMDSILRTYDETRLDNLREQEARRDYVYSHVDGYRELDESTVTVSMNAARQRLNGGNSDDLHKLLSDLKEMKKSLLKGAGLPADYLDPIYTCPDCHDTGYINNSQKCHCLKARITELLYNQSNIRDYIRNNNFNSLTYKYYSGDDLERFKRAVNISHSFVDDFESTCSNIMFYGEIGTGKSFLSGCIAHELLKSGHSVIYFSATQLFQELAQATFEYGSKEALHDLCEDIYDCDLLIIDDLGTELTNSFVSTQLFNLINERNLRKKSIIISTNLTLDDIRDRYSDRIFSRIIGGFATCKLTGPDIRILMKTK